ncbi:MAG: hypothetical protein HYX61_13400 [Gammaproteobacteria bacterium]|jgi:hypothetical protein|nr:hypothetical protein [Gammaproteobacteria bacterium]
MHVYTASDRSDIRNHIKVVEAMIRANRLDKDLQHILSGLKHELLNVPRLAIIDYLNALPSQEAMQTSWAHTFAKSRIHFMLPSLQKFSPDEVAAPQPADNNNHPPAQIRTKLNQSQVNTLAEICKHTSFGDGMANRYVSIGYLKDSLSLPIRHLQECLSELLVEGYITYDVENHNRIYITKSGEDYLKENENSLQQNIGDTIPTLNVALHQYRTKTKSLIEQFLPGLGAYPVVDAIATSNNLQNDDELTPLQTESKLLRFTDTTRKGKEKEKDVEIVEPNPMQKLKEKCRIM